MYQDGGDSEGESWVSFQKDKKGVRESSCLVLTHPIMSLLIFPARQVAERETSDSK